MTKNKCLLKVPQGPARTIEVLKEVYIMPYGVHRELTRAGSVAPATTASATTVPTVSAKANVTERQASDFHRLRSSREGDSVSLTWVRTPGELVYL